MIIHDENKRISDKVFVHIFRFVLERKQSIDG